MRGLVRGCGTRQIAAYATFKLRDKDDPSTQLPWQMFVPCPPWEVDVQTLGVGDMGIFIKERVDWRGEPLSVYDLYDLVGATYYPYPADFVMEFKEYGLSRLIPQTVLRSAAFKKLDAKHSQHILLHDKAIIVETEAYYKERTYIQKCPAGVEHHDANPNEMMEMCAGLWLEDVEFMKNTYDYRRHKVYMPRDYAKSNNAPSLSYQADHTPFGVDSEYRTGTVLVVPFGDIEIPRDQSREDKDQKIANLLESLGGNFTYEFTDE